MLYRSIDVKAFARNFLRWIGDVTRGYTRAADARDRAVEVLARADGSTLPAELCGFIADAHRDGGPLGVGARIACSPSELRTILVGAEDCATPLHVSARSTGAAA